MIQLDVLGIPQPKGSPRPIKVGGKIILTVKTKDGEAWECAIMRAVCQLPEFAEMPLMGPVGVWLIFRLPRPKSVKRTIPHVKPDIDKLARAALDGLARARVFLDDSQVCELHASKTYAQGQPGMHAIVYQDWI